MYNVKHYMYIVPSFQFLLSFKLFLLEIRFCKTTNANLRLLLGRVNESIVFVHVNHLLCLIRCTMGVYGVLNCDGVLFIA